MYFLSWCLLLVAVLLNLLPFVTFLFCVFVYRSVGIASVTLCTAFSLSLYFCLHSVLD